MIFSFFCRFDFDQRHSKPTDPLYPSIFRQSQNTVFYKYVPFLQQTRTKMRKKKLVHIKRFNLESMGMPPTSQIDKDRDE